MLVGDVSLLGHSVPHTLQVNGQVEKEEEGNLPLQCRQLQKLVLSSSLVRNYQAKKFLWKIAAN